MHRSHELENHCFRRINSVLRDALDGCAGGWWGKVQEGGGVCIHIADSLPCTAETNTTSPSNYTLVNSFFFLNLKMLWA